MSMDMLPDSFVEYILNQEKEELAKKGCTNCGQDIKVAIFKGSGFCSIDCRKAAGADVSSVGTYMHVTTEEKRRIMEARNG